MIPDSADDTESLPPTFTCELRSMTRNPRNVESYTQEVLRPLEDDEVADVISGDD